MRKIEEVLLSGRARHLLDFKPSNRGVSAAFFPGFFAGLAWMLLLAFRGTGTDLAVTLLQVVIASVLTVVTILVYRWKANQVRMEILEENARDWEFSQQILGIRDELLANPPNPLAPEHPSMKELEGWRPLEVRYFPDESTVGDILGAIEGTFYGTAFIVLRGAFEASIKAGIATETSPRLLGENVNALLKKDGEVLRIISPSIGLLRQMLHRAKEELSKGVKESTHTLGALDEVFGGSPRSLLILFENLNTSRLNDLIAASVKLPFEERPALRVIGLEVKPGVFLAFTAEQERGKPLALFPVNLLQDLGKRLQDLHKGRLVLPQEPVRFLPGE